MHIDTSLFCIARENGGILKMSNFTVLPSSCQSVPEYTRLSNDNYIGYKYNIKL
jgi:hypothetical protein